jgi:hypothetical protein
MAPYLFFLGVGTYTTYRRWFECVHLYCYARTRWLHACIWAGPRHVIAPS